MTVDLLSLGSEVGSARNARTTIDSCRGQKYYRSRMIGPVGRRCGGQQTTAQTQQILLENKVRPDRLNCPCRSIGRCGGDVYASHHPLVSHARVSARLRVSKLSENRYRPAFWRTPENLHLLLPVRMDMNETVPLLSIRILGQWLQGWRTPLDTLAVFLTLAGATVG